MLRYLGQRILHVVLVLLLVSVATYALLDLLPGSPAYAILGTDATPEAVAAIEEDLGLNDAFPVRYVRWLGDAVTGDLGKSFKDNQPVWKDMQPRIPVTVELAVGALLLALVVALPVGMWQAYRENRAADKGLGFAAFTLISMPPFLIAILLVFLFPITLDKFPVTGWARISDEGWWQNLRYAFLPILSLSLTEMAVLSQVLRGDMITTLKEDFVLSARAKGMPTGTILFKHALRPSSFSLVTLAAVNLGRLIGGTVVIESLFGIPGLGKMLVDAIAAKELVKVQAAVLLIATVYVVLNTLVDVTYGWLDPRVRRARG
ncbi:MAG: ABC transporter permease [Acidimicrobiales bacterium]|nr:ABC transporter permease [Acidimicrobiales bacterium]